MIPITSEKAYNIDILLDNQAYRRKIHYLTIVKSIVEARKGESYHAIISRAMAQNDIDRYGGNSLFQAGIQPVVENSRTIGCSERRLIEQDTAMGILFVAVSLFVLEILLCIWLVFFT